MKIFLVINKESNQSYFNLLAFWLVVIGANFFHLSVVVVDHVFLFFLHNVDIGVRDQALFDDLL
jgi:hypothetical protein